MTEVDGRNAWGDENERTGDRADDPRGDRFLVDGVAPAVIGGEPAPEPVSYPDPPTTPFPAAAPENVPRPERRSWLARVLRRE